MKWLAITLPAHSVVPAGKVTPSTTEGLAEVSLEPVSLIECAPDPSILGVCLKEKDSFFLFPPDLDECAEGVDICDQRCNNTIGSYTCSCGEGYTLNFDGFRCDG